MKAIWSTNCKITASDSCKAKASRFLQHASRRRYPNCGTNIRACYHSDPNYDEPKAKNEVTEELIPEEFIPEIVGLLREVLKQGKDANRVLNEHTQVLNEHTRVQKENTRVQKENTQMLNQLQGEVGIIKGSLMEDKIRKAVEHFHGSEFVEELTTVCVSDFVEHLTHQLGLDNSNINIGRLSRKVVQHLLEADMPRRVARSLLSLGKTKLSANADDAEIWKELGKMIGKDDTASSLRPALLRMQQFFAATTPQHKEDVLMETDGPGVMCLVAYVSSEKGSKEVKQPAELVQFDMKGRIALKSEQHIDIEVGEIKSSLDYATAVPQLGLRTGILRTIVELLMPDIQEITCTGYLYAPKSCVDRRSQDLKTDPQQMEIARTVYKMNLRMRLC